MEEIFNVDKNTKTESMYCVKCRVKVIVTGPNIVKWSNNKEALEGYCPHCNTKTFRVMKKNV